MHKIKIVTGKKVHKLPDNDTLKNKQEETKSLLKSSLKKISEYTDKLASQEILKEETLTKLEKDTEKLKEQNDLKLRQLSS